MSMTEEQAAAKLVEQGTISPSLVENRNGSAQRQPDLIIHINWDPSVPLLAWLKFSAAVHAAVAKELEKLEPKT